MERPHFNYRAAMMTLALAFMAAIMLAPNQANAAISTPVKAPNFNGTLNITRFATQTVNGATQLVAVGSVTGTLSAPNGVLQNVSVGDVVVPVAAVTNPSCPILSLTLGPLHLNVLGLVIDLNQVVLNITAIPGGGLLGDLLCGVANLLNPTQINQLVAVLNQILALL